MPAFLIATIAAVWGISISFLYYRLYPFTALIAGLPAVQVNGLGAGMVSAAALAVVYVIAVFGWGSWCLRAANDLSRLDRLLFSVALGFGLLALFVFVAAVAGITAPWYYLCLLAAGSLLALRSCLPLIRTLRAPTRPALLLLAAAVLPLLLTFFAAFAPATQFDSLVYHLALPARYLAAGQFIPVHHNIFFAFPQNLEMLFLSALALQGDQLANLIAWLFLPLTGLLIFAASRRFFSVTTAVIAALAWFTLPAALFLSTGTYVDVALAFYVTLSLYAVLLWRRDQGYFWIIIAGLLGGIACGIKYTAGIPVLLIALLVAGNARTVKPAACLCLSAAAAFLPWLAKNWWFLHNPIAPWGSAWVATVGITPEVAAAYLRHIAQHGMPVTSVTDLLLVPWNVTTRGFQYGGAFDLIGPVFILTLPLLFLMRKIDKITVLFIVYTVGYGTLWLFTGKVLRFLLPVMPVVCILAGIGCAHLANRVPRLRFPAVALLILAFIHNLLLFSWAMKDIEPYACVVGGEPRAAYLDRKINAHQALRTAVNTLPSGSTVLFWGETRGYYCTVPAVIPTVFDRNPLAMQANTAATAADLRAALVASGITHVFINHWESDRLALDTQLTAHGKALFQSFKEGFTRQLYRDRYTELLGIS